MSGLSHSCMLSCDRSKFFDYQLVAKKWLCFKRSESFYTQHKRVLLCCPVAKDTQVCPERNCFSYKEEGVNFCSRHFFFPTITFTRFP